MLFTTPFLTHQTNISAKSKEAKFTNLTNI